MEDKTDGRTKVMGGSNWWRTKLVEDQTDGRIKLMGGSNWWRIKLVEDQTDGSIKLMQEKTDGRTKVMEDKTDGGPNWWENKNLGILNILLSTGRHSGLSGKLPRFQLNNLVFKDAWYSKARKMLKSDIRYQRTSAKYPAAYFPFWPRGCQRLGCCLCSIS